MDQINRETYSTDLNNTEWDVIAPLLPVATSGRPRRWPVRVMLNAIFYIVRNGCAWRNLPHDLPPWKTVYTYFRNWRKDGTWRRIHDALRKKVRQAEGRHSQASAAILDSQSVKTTEKGGRAGTMRARK